MCVMGRLGFCTDTTPHLVQVHRERSTKLCRCRPAMHNSFPLVNIYWTSTACWALGTWQRTKKAASAPVGPLQTGKTRPGLGLQEEQVTREPRLQEQGPGWGNLQVSAASAKHPLFHKSGEKRPLSWPPSPFLSWRQCCPGVEKAGPTLPTLPHG